MNSDAANADAKAMVPIGNSGMDILLCSKYTLKMATAPSLTWYGMV